MDNKIYEDSLSMEETDQLDEHYENLVNKFVTDLNYGKIKGSNNKALASVGLLEEIIIMSQDASAIELISRVRAVGRRLEARAPHELIPPNMVRRVLRLIRDEHTQSLGAEGGDSLQRRVRGAARRNTLPDAAPALASPTLQHVAELRAEVEASDEAIAELLAPLIARNSPGPAPLTVRARAVLPAGDTLGPPGTTARAARAHSQREPVIVLCPLYKLSPSHCSALRHLSAPSCPSSTLSYRECPDSVAVVRPRLELVPAHLVTFFITNLGASSPSYVYRLLSELYDTRDYQL